MAPRTSRRQKTNASSNASGIKGVKHTRKYADDQDEVGTASPTTSTTVSSDSDQEWRSKKGQDSPSAPEKTSLRSVVEKAKDFVPSLEADNPFLELDPTEIENLGMLPPPFMPTPGKDRLAGIIQDALGSELWCLNMMDCTDYNGEWFTAVEVTIPALSASHCHLVTSDDAEAIDAAQQENQAQALKTLTSKLKGLAPNMVVQEADHRAQICVEFCAANRGKLCREFSQTCSCPRGDKCRWAHAMIETFFINFLLAPLDWCSQAGSPALQEDAATKEGRWVPQRPPMPPSDFQKPTPSSEDIKPMGPLAPDLRPKNPRLVSKKKWSDIQEDSDEDDVPIFFN